MSDGPLPRAGQRWWHPEVGGDFTPGTAVLEGRVAPSGEPGWASSGEPGWDYQGDDGNAGWIPEADLLARGELRG